MRHHYIRPVVLVCVLLSLGLIAIGCSSKTEQPDPNRSQSAAKQAGSATSDGQTTQGSQDQDDGDKASEAAVTVNGTVITEAQVSDRVEPIIEQMMARGQQLPPQFLHQYRQQIRQQVLDNLIIDILLAKELEGSDISVTDAQLSERIDEIAASQQPAMTAEQFQTRLEQAGRDFSEIKGEIRKGMLYSQLAERQWKGKVDVNEAEAKAFFEENKQQYGQEEKVRASHILIKPEDFEDANDPNAAALAKAEDLLKEIKDGADFAELAKTHSGCPSSQRGGDLDFFAKGQMVGPFEDAAWGMEVGEVSDIVKTQFGYHIIKKTDHQKAEDPTFAAVKDKVMEQLKQQKQGRIAQEFVESLKAKATIVYPPGKEPVQPQPGMPGMGGTPR